MTTQLMIMKSTLINVIRKLNYRILPDRFDKIKKGIIELNPDYWKNQEDLLYRECFNKKGQSTGHCGLLYSRYLTVRSKLRESGFLPPKKKKPRKTQRRSSGIIFRK